jgi:hypothetical protein
MYHRVCTAYATLQHSPYTCPLPVSSFRIQVFRSRAPAQHSAAKSYHSHDIFTPAFPTMYQTLEPPQSISSTQGSLAHRRSDTATAAACLPTPSRSSEAFDATALHAPSRPGTVDGPNTGFRVLILPASQSVYRT